MIKTLFLPFIWNSYSFRVITFWVITFCVRRFITFCVKKLLHFALTLLLHFAPIYYILRRNRLSSTEEWCQNCITANSSTQGHLGHGSRRWGRKRIKKIKNENLRKEILFCSRYLLFAAVEIPCPWGATPRDSLWHIPLERSVHGQVSRTCFSLLCLS